MDYDYEGEQAYESRVLWGRVGVYVGSLVLVFILGTCAGGGGEVSESEVQELRTRVADLSEQNVELEQTIAAMGSANTDDRPRISTTEESTESAEGDATTEADAGEGDSGSTQTETDAETDARIYVVEAGDTLTSIAQKMYGDSTQFTRIADANELGPQLVVGQELVIPPAN